MSCKKKSSNINIVDCQCRTDFEDKLKDNFVKLFANNNLMFNGKPIHALHINEKNDFFDFWHALCGYENAKKKIYKYNDIRASLTVLLEDLLSPTCDKCSNLMFYETYHNNKLSDLRTNILCLFNKYEIVLKNAGDKYVYITSFGELSYDQLKNFMINYHKYNKIKKPI